MDRNALQSSWALSREDRRAYLKAMEKDSRRSAPTCPKCGSVLSAVTWECVRGRYCK